jgi:hypothetical protein
LQRQHGSGKEIGGKLDDVHLDGGRPPSR